MNEEALAQWELSYQKKALETACKTNMFVQARVGVFFGGKNVNDPRSALTAVI